MVEMLWQLLIFCVVFGMLFYLVRLLPLPAPFNNIAQIILILIAIIVLIGFLPGIGYWHHNPFVQPN